MMHADSTPSVSRLYGNQFTPQVTDSQSAAAVGSLDTLFDGDASLSLNGILDRSKAVGVETLSNGNFLVVVSHDTVTTNAKVAMYNAEGTLQTLSYGSGTGIVDLGAVVTPRATMIDAQGRLLVAGGATSGTAGWIDRVSADGSTLTPFVTSTNWQFVGGLAQQSSGKIIAVGFNGSKAQIARYNLNGTVDTAFGTSGFVILNGTSGLPNSTNGLYSVIVDASNNIYTLALNSGNNAQLIKLNANGSSVNSYFIHTLDNVTAPYKLAFNQEGNIILAGVVTGVITVIAVQTDGTTAPSGWTNFSSSTGGTPNQNYVLNDILLSSGDTYGYIYLVGSDVTTEQMTVIRLGAHSGALDTAAFNTAGTPGYNFFQTTSGGMSAVTTAALQAAALAVDGQLYVPGYQIGTVATVPATTVPYISRLNSTQYAYEIAQFPIAQEQGILDIGFGNEAAQTYSGVVNPFNGKYGSSLQQRAQQVIEIRTEATTPGTGSAPIGDILVGSNGKTNTSSASNMMLSWLTSEGDLDVTMNSAGTSPGSLSLTNSTSSYEYLTSVLQGPSGAVFVAGYASATSGGASTQAFVRTYTPTGTTSGGINWAIGDATYNNVQATALYQAVGVGYQASADRTLMFVNEGSGIGHITAYNGPSLASWGDAGSGTINSTSYGLNMGPIYGGGLINSTDRLIVAFKNSTTGRVQAAKFLPDGSALDSSFGEGTPSGVSVDLFAGTGVAPTDIAANNIRTCFNSNGDVLVAALNYTTSSLLFTLLSAETGSVDAVFGDGTGLLTVNIPDFPSLQLQDLIGVSDGTALVTFYDNAADDTMYLARIITIGGLGVAGTLDTTFNSQGSQPGVLSFQIGDRVANYNARAVTCALVQSTAGANQGNIVMSGYESVTANDATPMVLRSFGDVGSTQVMSYPLVDVNLAGTFDVAYDLVGDLGASEAKVVFTYPNDNTYEGYSLIGYDNGTTSKIARYDVTTNILDATFGTAGIYTIPGSLSGISTLSIDSKNRVIVGGTAGSTPWAYQIAADGDSSVSFGAFPAGMNQVNQILEQRSGRYIVAGRTSAPAGILVAFQSELPTPNSLSATTLAMDTTFNPLASGSVAGSYVLGLTGIYSIAINTDDTIATVFKNNNSGNYNLVVAEITANGSGLNTSFGTIGYTITGITPDSSSVCRVAISSEGKIVVAASADSGGSVAVQRFLRTAFVDTSWIGSSGAGTATYVSNLGSAGITLSDLMETTANQTIFLGYNTAQAGSPAHANGPLFACRLNATGQLDSTWNESAPITSSDSDTPGVLTFATNSVTVMNGSAMTIDGKIVAVGAQSGLTSGDPVVMYIYGDNYVTQIVQAPLASAAGVLDLTIPGGSTGALALASTITGVPQKIAIYNNSSNGSMMVASSDGTSSYVTKLNADLTVGTYGTSGIATLTGLDTINDMYLVGDVNSSTLAPILVTGSTAGAMWGANINTAGTAITYLADAGGMTTGNVIRQTSNGRILVAGYNGTSGCIAAFESITSSGVYPLDLSFGNNAGTSPNYGGGVYATGVATQIYEMAVDSYDRIYIAYLSGSDIVVQRLLANGTGIDSTFAATFTSAVNGYSSFEIRLALDEDQNQLVVVAQDGQLVNNILQVCRFSIVDGSSSGSLSNITISGRVLNVSDLFIDTAENIYVIGYSGVGNSIVARIVTTSSIAIALDTTGYAVAGGTPGIANVSAGSMSAVTAGAYSQDKRTYFVGSNGSTLGYIARLYGDIYTQEVSEAIATATVGSIDTSLQPNNTGAIDLSGQTGWLGLSGYTAYAVLVNPNNDGTAFIAFGNGANLVVGKVDADMNPVTTFGGLTTGLTTPFGMDIVNSLDLDSDANIIVAGSQGGSQKVASFTSSGELAATFATTILAANATVAVQQKSGRYIVGSYDGATGLIIAYQNQSAIAEGILPIDLTFGPAGSNGFYATGVNAPIDDLCIDSDDNIYFVYRNSGAVCLGKLTANGSGLVNAVNSSAAFNSGSIITTGITGVTQPAHIAINSEGNILVGGVLIGDGVLVETALYNGTTGIIIGSPVEVLFQDTSAVLTKLVGSGTEFYGLVYSTNSSVVSMTVFAINSSGGLDSAFNPTSGFNTSIVGSPVAMYGLSVQDDGKLVAVGYTSGVNPLLMRFFGYQYVPQFAQAPDRVAAGHLDTTMWPTTGAFPLNHTSNSTFNSLMSGYAVKRVYEAGNGIMTFVADSGNDTVIFQFLKDLTLNTAFNASGYIVYTGTYGGTTGLYVDSLGNIFMSGNNSSGSWVVALTSVGGDLPPGFITSDNLTAAYAINQQASSRVILAGLAGANGGILGYNNVGDLDATFAANGVLISGIYPFTDIAIDQWDRIITVSNQSGTVALQRANSSGSSLSSLNAGTAISTAVPDSNIKVVLDNQGNIVVAAATATGYILRSYRNDATGTGIDAYNLSIETANFILSNMYATNDNKITLVGYESTLGKVVVARFTSFDGSLNLDTTSFNASTGYLYTTIGLLDQAYDAIIHADNRIMVVGSNSSAANPYMGRAFGYPYADYVTQGPIAGVAGTINPAFGNTSPTTGTYDISTLNSILNGAQGKAIFPLANGGYYMALDNANEAANSVLIKTVGSGALDTTYNSTGIATTYAPLGVNSILQDGSGNVVLVGTTDGAGWIQRYTSAGALDTTFNGTGIIELPADTQATVALEQSLARLVVAGRNVDGDATLFAYQSLSPNGIPGTVDTTFNSTGSVPGTLSLSSAHIISCVIADNYDRLIFGLLNASGNVDLYRLTPTGELDITFGVNGVVVDAIVPIDAASALSIRVALDLQGNIVLAASDQTENSFYVRAFNNGTLTTTGGNGASVYSQLTISSLIYSPVVTNLVTSADGYALIVGTQSSANPAWIARITAGGLLDTADFNPHAVGGIAGIFQYPGSGATSHTYSGLAVNADGTLGMFGYEDSSSVYTPTLVSVYDDPYTSQQAQSPNSKAVGTNDVTFGVSPMSTGNKGIIFFGASGDGTSGQVARALGLYDNNNVVVAIDGNSATGSGTSEIMINMFDNDGIPNPNFGTAGSEIVLSNYENQYVRDMVTFTTIDGVHKAILAGYVTNSALGTTDSLLLQYILTPGLSGLDTTFGGFDGNPEGIAFGDGQSLFSVAQQSNGRIIAAGLSQNNLGLLLGYGADGKMDSSFANNGYQSSSTGEAGIYTHAIDTNNNIAFAYNDGSDNVAVARYLADGSAIDTSFAATSLITGISGNSNMKIALDSSNNVYAAAVTSTGNGITINSYDTANGDVLHSVEIIGAALGNASAVYTLGRLVVDAAGNTIITAFDSNSQQVIVIRLTPGFILDVTFNNGAGYVLYPVAYHSLSATDAMIHPDGRIFIAGSSEDAA